MEMATTFKKRNTKRTLTGFISIIQKYCTVEIKGTITQTLKYIP